MNSAGAATFEKLLRECDLGWMIDWHVPKDEAVDFWLRILSDVQEASRQRFGDAAPDLSPDALASEYARNPLKVAAFLQALSGRGSPQMLVMVWRIAIQGLEVESVEMRYQWQTEFNLCVELRSLSGTDPETYVSYDISDAKLIRHFGTFKSNGKPVFSGFYPLRLEAT
jgi:hypothetical protein